MLKPTNSPTPKKLTAVRSQKPLCGKIVGYARVSTTDQTVRQQEDVLLAAGCVEVVCEQPMSGGTTSRPALDALLASLVAGDTLCVVAISRLGRSMLHTVRTILELDARGVVVKSLEGFDTKTPIGRMILTMFAGFAEMELHQIQERTRAALQAKKRRGERLGRPPALTPEQEQHVRDLVSAGESKRRVAKLLEVDRATVYRAIGKKTA